MSGTNPLAAQLAARIRAEGPISYSAFLDVALYDDARGFYASHGSAGRRGDFLTSPEVGPLFGAVLARALDDWWRELGEPASFRLVEGGAGRGTLARAIRAAEPRCIDALDHVLVERSDRLRAEQPTGPGIRSVATLPDDTRPGVVLANELLDNLAFDLFEWRGGGWHEVRVGLDDGEGLAEVVVPLTTAHELVGLPAADDGARIPWQRQAAAWLRDALRVTAPGRVVVIDYADTTAHFAQRPWHEWLRTYRGHDRGDAPLVEPGRQDVTCEVAIDQLARVRTPAADRAQADFLRAHGLDELVDEGRRVWHQRAHLGDLAAMRARSRVREAESLVAPDGLGAFRVLEWTTGQSD